MREEAADCTATPSIALALLALVPVLFPAPVRGSSPTSTTRLVEDVRLVERGDTGLVVREPVTRADGVREKEADEATAFFREGEEGRVREECECACRSVVPSRRERPEDVDIIPLPAPVVSPPPPASSAPDPAPPLPLIDSPVVAAMREAGSPAVIAVGGMAGSSNEAVEGAGEVPLPIV